MPDGNSFAHAHAYMNNYPNRPVMTLLIKNVKLLSASWIIIISVAHWPVDLEQLSIRRVAIHRCSLTVSAASSKHFCFQISPCVFSSLEIFLPMHALYKFTFHLLTF